MDDSKIIKDIVTGMVDMEDLQERILDIFMGEIQTEILKDTPVDTGYMRQHWHEQKLTRTQIEFANNTAYLPFHITGTGLYGPKHQMICAKGMSKKNPKHAHVMAWKPRGSSKMVFRRCVKGMRPNSFIEDGIEAGIANGCEAVMDLFTRAGNVIE
jgi:hypothetical protein